jgi:hypothetical protein
VDFTHRPHSVFGGRLEALVDGRRVVVRRRRGTTFMVSAPRGATVIVSAASARDRFGNLNGAPAVLAVP